MMKNKDNKKSTDQWLLQLFTEPGLSPVKIPQKIHYTHRFGQNDEQHRQASSRLVYEGSTIENDHTLTPDNFQQFFKRPTPRTTDIPLSFEAYPQHNTQLAPSINVSAKHSENEGLKGIFTVLNCFNETPDTKTFRLAGQREQHFDYLPGQYITLSTLIGGQTYKRSYSLASSPSRPRILEITVKRAPNGGIVSNWLNDHLKIGDIVNLQGPFGKFSCLYQKSRKILFLAAGSGIVPIMSMLRWLSDTDSQVDIRLLLSFRGYNDIIFHDELNLIAERHKNIEIDITLTTNAIDQRLWKGLTGRMSETMLNELVPDLQERTVYLCGPNAFMEAAKAHLHNLNLPKNQLFCENFSVTSHASMQSELNNKLAPRQKTGNFQVSFAKSAKSVATDGCLTLLEIAEKSGIPIRHECRNGQCGECMVKCLKGKVEMLDQAEIDAIDRNKGWLFACCSYPSSDIELDA